MKKSIQLLAICILLVQDLYATNPCNRYGLYICKTSSGYCLEDSIRLRENGIFEQVMSQPDVLVPYTCSRPFTFVDHAVKHNLLYKNCFGQESRVMLILPEKSQKPVPVIFYIHGGGWYDGLPEWFEKQARYFASHGIAVAGLCYTLIPQGGTHIKAVAELRDGMKQLFHQAHKWNIDPKQFGFCGDSAGGYLSSYMAMTTPHCRVYIGICGLYNPAYSQDGNFPTAECKRLFFGTDDTTRLKEVAPIELVRKHGPHTILLHGSADPTINCRQATDFAARIIASGGVAQTEIFKGYGHLFAVEALSDCFPQVVETACLFALNNFEH